MPNQAKEELKRFYDSIYLKGDIRDNDKLYAWIIRLFYSEKERKFLDVGCGGGWLLREAEKFGLATYGLDVSAEAVGRERECAAFRNFSRRRRNSSLARK